MLELNFPNPVRQAQDLYGRRVELERIERVIASGARRPVVVYGERRIGKTSLLHVVAARLSEVSEPRITPLFPATVGVYSLQDFAKEALQSLCAFRGTSLRARGLLGTAGQFHMATIGQFVDETKELLRDSPATIHLLCIDEFDALLHNCTAYGQDVEAFKILDLCHQLVMQSDPLLTFLFTMTRLPDAVRDSVYTLVIDEAERIDLYPLSYTESDELLDGIFGTRVAFERAQREQLERLAGGHPYLLKLLLANWLHRFSAEAPPERATASALEQAAGAAACDPRAEHALGNLLRVHFEPRERDLVTLMAALGDRIAPGQIGRVDITWHTAAENLVRRGYLLGEGDGGYRFRAALLGRWLRQRPVFEEHLYRLEDLRQQMTGEAKGAATTGQESENEIDIEFDPDQRRLYLRGREMRLTPQEYRTLFCLCENRERLVTKDELSQYVWPESAGNVSEAAIDAIVYRLRRKLQDDARQPRYLETVVGQGFILHRAAFIRPGQGLKEQL